MFAIMRYSVQNLRIWVLFPYFSGFFREIKPFHNIAPWQRNNRY
jgi:hypothetical protein